MKKIHLAAAAWLALSATGAHAAETAQKSPCLTAAEAQALFTAIAPPALKAVTGACSAALPADAYLRTKGDDLVKRYRIAAVAARPVAVSAIGKLSGAGTITPEMFDGFAEPMIEQLVSKEIKPDVCIKLDRVAALLDPLPPANLAGLVALILEFAAKDSKAPPIEICKGG